MVEHGYIPSSVESCIYSKPSDDGRYLICCTHVDDFFVSGSDDAMITHLYNILTNAFGPVTFKSDDTLPHLGMSVTRTSSVMLNYHNVHTLTKSYH